jgi:peptidoglycan/LPS O-acetylase OafA/YrhL
VESSTGKYYVGLDHVRALAVFTVFSWHFLHINQGHITPMPGVFSFPLNSFFAEGHTGVAIFMVLSGYLFAKITDEKNIRFLPFMYNRVLRLLPLLFAVILIHAVLLAVSGGMDPLLPYFKKISQGLLYPTLPNGGWSITAEFHFYLLFPLILLIEKKKRKLSLIFILAAIIVRILLRYKYGLGMLQGLTYFTLIGRIDQFVLGILFYKYGDFFKGKHILIAFLSIAWILLWQQFDKVGGFYNSKKFGDIWIILTLLEGLVYGTIITWYDKSFSFKSTGISKVVAKIGEWSYSIYILHFFFVFRMASFINRKIIVLDNFYVAFIFNILSFILICGLSAAVYYQFERRFLILRKPYLY